MNQVAWKIKDILYHNISDVIITNHYNPQRAVCHCLYTGNTKSKDYLNKNTRSKALEEIASKLGKTGKVPNIN